MVAGARVRSGLGGRDPCATYRLPSRGSGTPAGADRGLLSIQEERGPVSWRRNRRSSGGRPAAASGRVMTGSSRSHCPFRAPKPWHTFPSTRGLSPVLNRGPQIRPRYLLAARRPGPERPSAVAPGPETAGRPLLGGAPALAQRAPTPAASTFIGR